MNIYIVFISTRISVFECPIQHGSVVNRNMNFNKKSTEKRTIGLNCTDTWGRIVSDSISHTRSLICIKNQHTNAYIFSMFRHEINTTFHFEILRLTAITKLLLVIVHRIFGCSIIRAHRATTPRRSPGHRSAAWSTVVPRLVPTYRPPVKPSNHSFVRRCREHFTSDFPGNTSRRSERVYRYRGGKLCLRHIYKNIK